MRLQLDPFSANGVSMVQPTSNVLTGIGGNTVATTTSGQTWKVDRIPFESPNGSTTVFTLPEGDTYVANTLVVYLNGQALTKTADFSETTSSTFTFVVAPLTGDVIRLIYRTS